MSVRDTSLTGRVCVITGATSGIGLETARQLSRMGASLALVGRNPERLHQVVEELRAGPAAPIARGYVADLSSLAEVRRVSDELLEAHPRIDVLVNNAGALFLHRESTAEGIERTWALNVLSPFLLTHRLAGRLLESAPARIVNVASAAHAGAHLRLDDPEGKGRYSGYGAYSRSKLALILWTYELARRLAPTAVTVNALHPGFVSTGFGKNNRGIGGRTIGVLSFLFGIRPKKGASTSVYLASSPEVAGVTGKYFARERPTRSSAASYASEDGGALWAILCAQTGVPPEAPLLGNRRAESPTGDGARHS